MFRSIDTKLKHIITMLLIMASFQYSCTKDSSPIEEPEPELPAEDKYIDLSFSGFIVKINERYTDEHDAKIAIDFIEEDLKKIVKLLPEHALEVMRPRPIWLEKNIRTDGAAWYHISRDWLISQDMNPEKEKSVEINNYVNYVDWSKLNQPLMLLHELAHLYHDLGITFDHPEVLAAYNNAITNNLYLDIERHDGYGRYSTVARAYALNNHHEYFAELSEAYFGENDFFPFTREELMDYDPMGYEVIDKIWRNLD